MLLLCSKGRAEIEPIAGERIRCSHRSIQATLAHETSTLTLSRAMDSINQRFGRNAVSRGPLHGGRIDRIGSKIAFGRIPDLGGFHE
jgi:DNA polymerase-4